jgi:phosphoglycerate dehydrogenase-like enzyme
MQVWGLVQDPSKRQQAEKSEKSDETRVFALASIKEFMAGVDYVINTLPNTPVTTNMLSPYKPGEEVQCLFSNTTKKPVFINVGRGSIL